MLANVAIESYLVAKMVVPRYFHWIELSFCPNPMFLLLCFWLSKEKKIQRCPSNFEDIFHYCRHIASTFLLWESLPRDTHLVMVAKVWLVSSCSSGSGNWKKQLSSILVSIAACSLNIHTLAALYAYIITQHFSCSLLIRLETESPMEIRRTPGGGTLKSPRFGLRAVLSSGDHACKISAFSPAYRNSCPTTVINSAKQQSQRCANTPQHQKTRAISMKHAPNEF